MRENTLHEQEKISVLAIKTALTRANLLFVGLGYWVAGPEGSRINDYTVNPYKCKSLSLSTL